MSKDGQTRLTGQVHGCQQLQQLAVLTPLDEVRSRCLLSTFTRRKTLKLLCLGAHLDDVEIGCGGLLARHTTVDFDWEYLATAVRKPRDKYFFSAETFTALMRL